MNSRNSPPSKVEAVALGMVATGAVSIAVAAIVGATGAAIEIFGSSLAVDLPVDHSPIESLADAGGVTASSYTQSMVTLDSLDAGTRWLLFAEVALPALATVIVCMALWWLGVSLIRQRAFRRSMPHVLGAAGIGLVLAGMVGPFLGGLGRAAVIKQLMASGADTSGFWAFMFTVNLAAIGWGIALALVATAFEVGQRLQRETEGLV